MIVKEIESGFQERRQNENQEQAVKEKLPLVMNEGVYDKDLEKVEIEVKTKESEEEEENFQVPEDQKEEINQVVEKQSEKITIS